MSKQVIGYLGYNSDTERYGFLYGDIWQDTGLHCGECVEVLVNGKWVQDRIEMSWEGNWYLVESKLKGSQLEHLQVKCEFRNQ